VKIIKALALNPKVLIMDEPTTMFNSKDAERVLQLVKDISSRGIGVIYISHNLKEVVRIADRITVLRDGQFVNCHERAAEKIDLNVITREMVGRAVNLFYEREKSEIGEIILEIQGLKLTKTSPALNFCLRQGEILGIAGMVGAGRTEMVRAIFGADRRAAGSLRYKGQPVNPKALLKPFAWDSDSSRKTGRKAAWCFR
jgi:ABC-type sugar transport system ATPase subunit